MLDGLPEPACEYGFTDEQILFAVQDQWVVFWQLFGPRAVWNCAEHGTAYYAHDVREIWWQLRAGHESPPAVGLTADQIVDALSAVPGVGTEVDQLRTRGYGSDVIVDVLLDPCSREWREGEEPVPLLAALTDRDLDLGTVARRAQARSLLRRDDQPPAQGAAPMVRDRPIPVVALDVDGVLNPSPSERPDPAPERLHDYADHSAPLEPGIVFNRFLRGNGEERLESTISLSPSHGRWINSLLARGVEVVWATTWEQHANLIIAPLLGIPDLPLGCTYAADAKAGHWDPVRFSDHNASTWKSHVLRSKYVGRPLVWADDHLPLQSRQGEWRSEATLLSSCNPDLGLTGREMRRVDRWLDSIGWPLRSDGAQADD